MAGESQFVKVLGVWRAPNPGDTNDQYIKVNGSWRANNPGDTNAKYVKVNGQWREIADSNPPPSPGTYYLSATSQDLFGENGFSEYDTTEYRGSITEIRARVSWIQQITCVGGLNFATSGRPNGNFYRNITSDESFCGRTIDHRIDTFDATSLTDFNSGAAIGFTYNTAGLAIQNGWSNVQLGLTIA